MQGILPTSRSPGGRGGLARGGGRGYMPSIGRGTRGYYGRSRGYRGRGILTIQKAYHLNQPRNHKRRGLFTLNPTIYYYFRW